MSKREIEPAVHQSVLDRLIDIEPHLDADPVTTWRESVGRLRAAVVRDLEWLLNTRRIARVAPPRFAELWASVYHFGLADVTSLSQDSEETRGLLRRRIEECIRLFEPRLTGVRVNVVDGEANAPNRVRFTIEALLRMEPEPERITFDTVLEVASGAFHVTGTRDA